MRAVRIAVSDNSLFRLIGVEAGRELLQLGLLHVLLWNRRSRAGAP